MNRLTKAWMSLSRVQKFGVIVGAVVALLAIVSVNQPANQPAANNTDTQQSQSTDTPRVAEERSFDDFVKWYGDNRSTIVESCSSGSEAQSVACLKDVYKDFLRPELFDKQNEVAKGDLISNVAIMNADSPYNEGADVAKAKQVYSDFAAQ